MPATRRTHPCGHRGHGKSCARCGQADRLLARPNAGPEEERDAGLLKMPAKQARAAREQERKQVAQAAEERARREEAEYARLARIDETNLGHETCPP